MLIRNRLMEFFAKAVDRNELEITDFKLAADQFHELCKADLFPRMVFNMTDEFTREEKMRVVDGAVDMFMARYGTK